MSKAETEKTAGDKALDALNAGGNWGELVSFGPDVSVYERLGWILGELPSIGKTSRNQQQQFDYRSHDDVLNALNPLLSKAQVFIVPDVIDRQIGERATGQGKTMYEVNLHVRFTVYGPAGDSVSGSAWGEGTDMGDKSTNKAMTMAFKNFLAQTFAVATGEYDTDADSPEPTTRAGGAAQQAPGRSQTRSRARGPFDPGKQMLDGAIALDAHVWNRIGEALQEIGPTTDWKASLFPLLSATFGVATREEIHADRMPEYARRMSNAIQKIRQDVDTTGFPPVEETNPAAIIEAFQWAFGGATGMTIIRKPEQQEAEMDDAAAEAAAIEAQDTLPGDDVEWPGEAPSDEPRGTQV